MNRILLAVILLVSAITSQAIVISPEGIISETTYYDDIPYKRTLYTRDDQGRVTTEDMYYYSDEQGFYISAKYEYEYNERGDLKSRVYYIYKSANGKFEPRSQRLYTYDSNGRLTRYLTQTKKSGYDWTNDFKREYTYNEQGLIETQSEYQYYAGRFQLLSESTSTYDNTGNKIGEHSKFNGEGGWSSTWSTYTYDTNARLTSCDQYSNEEHTDHIEHNDYSYDEKGLLVKDCDYRKGATDAQPEPYCETTYAYNTHGDLTAEAAHYYVFEAGGIYYNEDYSYSYSYEYDTQDRIIRFNFHDGDNGYTIYEYPPTNPSGLGNVASTLQDVKKVSCNGHIEIISPRGTYTTSGIRIP